MGKHDKVIQTSSDEFYENRIEDLEDRLTYANETIRRLQEQCSRMSKWASEIEANAKDALEKEKAETRKWKAKCLGLVEHYVEV